MALHIQLAKIPGLTACANWEGNTWENLVAHPQLQEGTYCLKEAFGEFRVTLEGASLTLKTIEGFTFYLKDAGDYPVLYFSDGTTAFSWDGGTQLKTGAPAQVMDPTMLSRQK